MADEITITSGMTCTNGSLRVNVPTKSYRATQATGRACANTQDIGTTHEALAFGSDIATAGFAVFTNLDATNYVEIGVVVAGTFYPAIRVSPGEQQGPVRFASLSVYAKANTAPVKLKYDMLEA